MINCYTNNKGFTFVETLVALMVFTIGILALNKMQLISIWGNSNASGITTTSNWAGDRIELIIGAPYTPTLPSTCADGDEIDPLDEKDPQYFLCDDDGDGTGEDTTPNDGVDDDGGNFGLDDIVNPDGMFVSPDGLYTIYWNVAVDEPMPNLKTIRVIVTRNFLGMQKQVTLDYCKINTF